MRLPRGLVRVFNRFGNMTTTHRYDEPIPVVVGRVSASPEQVVAVSDQDPLPVVVGASSSNPLPVDLVNKETRARNADLLLLQTTTVDTTAKDLLGITAAEIATIGNAGQHRTLIWTGFKNQAADISYTVFARTTDADGNPFGTGWLQIATGTISGAANSWFRVAITQTEGLYYDQYRIVVSQTSGSQTLHSKIVGVRG